MLHLQFTPFPIITTERLVLRHITEQDANEMFVLRSHPIVQKFIKRKPALNVEEALQFIQKINKQEENKEVITWGLVLKGEEKLIGNVCFWRIENEQAQAEIGYSLHPDFFSKGIMTEALKDVLAYGFDKMKLKRVDAYTQKENLASRALLTKLGFERNLAFEHEYENKEELEYNTIYTLLAPMFKGL